MTTALFLSAVLALLLAPGPTNTLMGLVGAQRGFAGMARLLPAELLGYLGAILPLAYLGAELLARWPAAASGLKAIAAAWVMYLAVRLWGRHDEPETGREVSARQVCLTTFLNPKALIFSLVLLPAPHEPDFAPRLGLFCLLVMAVALVWGAGGALTRTAGSANRLLILRRIASLWLGVVSVTLIAGLIRA